MTIEGNSPSNIVNNGLAASEDGNIFYTIDSGLRFINTILKR